MAYKDKRVNVKILQPIADEIMALDLSGKSLTDRTNWLLKQQLKQRLPEAGEKALKEQK